MADDYTLNRTGTQIDAIGTMYTATSSVESIPNSAPTVIATLQVPAGTYIVTGELITANRATGTLRLSLGYSDQLAYNTNGIVSVPITSGSGDYKRTQVIRIMQIAAINNTIYLDAWQNSGDVLPMPVASVEASSITAIRIR